MDCNLTFAIYAMIFIMQDFYYDITGKRRKSSIVFNADLTFGAFSEKPQFSEW